MKVFFGKRSTTPRCASCRCSSCAKTIATRRSPPQQHRQLKDNLSDKVEAFGVKTTTLFGNDVVKVRQTLDEAIQSMRRGEGPRFIQAYTYRWNSHVGPEDDSVNNYRAPGELDFWKQNCPIVLLEEKLLAAGILTAAQKDQILGEIDKEIQDAFAFAKKSPFPKNADWAALNYCAVSPWPTSCSSTPNTKSSIKTRPKPCPDRTKLFLNSSANRTHSRTHMRELSYAGAINEALAQSMELCPDVLVMGQLVNYKSGVFGTTTGLVDKFGPQRVLDFPVAESLMTSSAIGAAVAGMRRSSCISARIS